MPRELEDERADATPGDGAYLVDDDTVLEDAPESAEDKPHPSAIIAARRIGIPGNVIERATAAELDFLVANYTPETASQTPEPKKPEPPAPRPSQVAAIVKTLKDGGYDDVLIEQFASLAKSNEELRELLDNKDAAIKEVRAELLNVSENSRKNTQAEFERQVEAGFAKINLPKFFGEGHWTSLKAGGPKVVRRQAVVNLAASLPGNDPIGEKMAKAVEQLYGRKPRPKTDDAEDDRPAKTGKESAREALAKQWREAALPRPTSRSNSPEPETGKQQAIAEVRKLMRGIATRTKK